MYKYYEFNNHGTAVSSSCMLITTYMYMYMYVALLPGSTLQLLLHNVEKHTVQYKLGSGAWERGYMYAVFLLTVILNLWYPPLHLQVVTVY